MSQLHGKQIYKKTITQEHLLLQTPNSGDTLSGATVEYVNNMAGTNVIGPAEYTDEYDYGIFTDFNSLTRTGVAVDRFNQLFLKLAPTPPSPFESVPLNITSTEYLSRMLGTGNPVTIISDDTPSFALNIPSNGIEGSDSGTLSFYIDSNIQETTDVTLTDNKNTGVIRYTSGDPYDDISGKEGFWNSFLTMNIESNSIVSSVNQRLAELVHSEKGILSKTFYLDTPLNTSIGSVTNISIPPMTGYISGVPTLKTTDQISNLSFTINNVSSYFYAANSVWEVQSGLVNHIEGNPLTIPQSYGETGIVNNKTLSIRSNVFSDNNFYFVVRAKNSIGTFGTPYTYTDTTRRVDTVSNETIRRTSGTGSYPSTGWGGTYDSIQSLVGSYANELMLKNGTYQYPNGDYTSIGGSNYNGVTGTRWVTFTTLGVFNNNSSFTLNFIDSQGITSIGLDNLLVEVKISGSTYWVDGDSAYAGVGNPGSSSDGISAVVTNNSTPTSRRITFGSITYSGPIVIRIGITNNNITFRNITITNIV